MSDKPASIEDSDALLTYRVGPVLCCGPTLPIITITPPPKLTHPPGTHAAEPGIFKHGPYIVSATDLRYRFGVKQVNWNQPGQVIIVKQDNQARGYFVDEIKDVIRFPETGWGQLPVCLPKGIFSRTLLLNEQIHLYADFEKLAKLQDSGYLKEYIEQLEQARQTQDKTNQQTRLTSGSASKKLQKNTNKQATTPENLEQKPGSHAADKINQTSLHQNKPVLTDSDSVTHIDTNNNKTIEKNSQNKTTAATAGLKSSIGGASSAPKNKSHSAIDDNKIKPSAKKTVSRQTVQQENIAKDFNSKQKLESQISSDQTEANIHANRTTGKPVHEKLKAANKTANRTKPESDRPVQQNTATPKTAIMTSAKAVTENSPTHRGGNTNRAALQSSQTETDKTTEKNVNQNNTSVKKHETESSTGGWLVFIVLLLLFAGGAYYYFNYSQPSATNDITQNNISQSDINQNEIIRNENSRKGDNTDSMENTINDPVDNSNPLITENTPTDSIAKDDRTEHSEQADNIQNTPEATPLTPAETASEIKKTEANVTTDKTTTENYHAAIHHEDDTITIELDGPLPPEVNTPEQAETKSLNKPEPTQPVEGETGTQADTHKTSDNEETPVEPLQNTASKTVAKEKQQQTTSEKTEVSKNTSIEIVHIIVKGDTLWAIAKRYLKNPFRYPELAKLSKIKNPDLIYPGNKVIIIYRQQK